MPTRLIESFNYTYAAWMAAGFFVVVVLVTLWRIRKLVRWQNRRWGGLCIHCGYNLSRNLSGVCPECGKDVDSLPR